MVKICGISRFDVEQTEGAGSSWLDEKNGVGPSYSNSVYGISAIIIPEAALVLA